MDLRQGDYGMSVVRCIYRDDAPNFPATDQHPDAVRYGPIELAGNIVVFVDAIGGEPSIEEIDAALNPPQPPEPTLAERLAAAGWTPADLRAALGI